MNRAVVLIGVSQAGSMTKLQAVEDSLKRMQDWAQAQGISTENLKVISDRDGTKEVSAADVLQVVEELVNRNTIEQLVIYFTGHGINVSHNEYWLLSQYPQNALAAVNLFGSEEAARTGTIPHVVFISDACRTPAQTIRDQNILTQSMTIYPNLRGGGTFQEVDVFYASLLGKPALEVLGDRDTFHGIFTEMLADVLLGNPDISEADPVLQENVVRPWPLKKHLTSAVPLRISQMQPRPKSSQQPDATVSSNPAAWISLVNDSGVRSTLPPGTRALEDEPRVEPSLSDLAQAALVKALEPSDTRLYVPDDTTLGAEASTRAGFEEFESKVEHTAAPFGPMHFESECGFKVRGAKISRAICLGGSAEMANESDSACRIALDSNSRYANTLLIFDSGRSTVLPAIEGFVGGLSFEEEDLRDVTYEPSSNTSRWSVYEGRKEKLRKLRAVIAASTRMGTFQLSDEEAAIDVAREMQLQKGIDPSLSIYAAYAYRRQGRYERLREMQSFLRNDLGFVFLDVALLAGALSGNTPNRFAGVAPWWPLLNQGWSLLGSFREEVPAELFSLPARLVFDSLWTLFDAKGSELLTEYFANSKE